MTYPYPNIHIDVDIDREIDAADDVRAVLWDRVRSALRQPASDAACVTRVTVPLDDAPDPLDWLHAQPFGEAAYWSGRDDDRTVAACGVADVLARGAQPLDYDALRRGLDARLADAPDAVRYYGGLRFDASQPPAPDAPDVLWDGFGTSRFVLPRFEIVRDGGGTHLACSLVLPRDAERPHALRRAVDALVLPTTVSPGALPSPQARADAPAHAAWTRMVHWALDAFDAETLAKVVLARRATFDFGEALDPLLLLHHLQPATPGCFHFAFRPDGGAGDRGDGAPAWMGGSTFLGASPERLFHVSGRTVHSEAVAGTRSRGDSVQSDAALHDELLESEKDRREHAHVEDAILDTLATLCTDVRPVQDPTALTLARGRHLRSRLQGTLHDDVHPVDVLAALHPTPAVGGVPTRDALDAIRTQEPFDRGWYAGPVGWIGRDAAEFAVAIRCGLVRHDRLALYSGAGIVEGSDPDAEWDEIEQKIGDFAAVLGL